MIKALLWDCDNTLIKTAELHFAKHVAVLKRYGIDLDDRFRPTIYANNSIQNWDILSKAFDIPTTGDAYIAEIDKWYQDNIGTLQIRSGIVEVLDLAKEHGIKQAVVSNGRAESVMAGLTAKGLIPYFDIILTRSDYTERKPHPEPYLVALDKLGLAPHEALAIEDDPKGAQSAINANIPTIHYRYSDDMPPVIEAAYSCYNGVDFINYMNKVIHG
ncbi:MAG: hypothetical protein CL561_11890 [Alphaproteobacteria bacterium]|nr:hypothetical protein [Alphaproteobacteria bacterium]|tara:strand:- start:4858 stop:5505 length:648 start_codon:yes stop_codon:yes gene_type:complete